MEVILNFCSSHFYILLITLILTFVYTVVLSQGVAINADGSTPDGSAMLDIKSTNTGILIPRMTTVQRTTITSPANSLLAFDETTGSFRYYDFTYTEWLEIIDRTNNFILSDEDTYITVEENPDDDIARVYIGLHKRHSNRKYLQDFCR